MLTNDRLAGCHVALITPMTARGSLMVIDYEKLYGLVDRCLDAGVAGLLFAGTTGQSATLSHSEQIELCARGIDYARAGAAARLLVHAADPGHPPQFALLLRLFQCFQNVGHVQKPC